MEVQKEILKINLHTTKKILKKKIDGQCQNSSSRTNIVYLVEYMLELSEGVQAKIEELDLYLDSEVI